MRPDDNAWLPEEHYRLLRKLGVGGMGEVWLADDLLNGRQVAVKRLRPEGDGTAEMQEMRLRFHREFLLLSRFDHPGIVRAFEKSADPERPWFTMELVEGWLLGEYLQGGHWQGGESAPKYHESPEGLRQVWILGEELLAILARLHADSCIHRDLKPSNLMVERGGRLKLIDFGLAREIAAPMDLTSSGIVGTPVYLSPEQVRGQPLDGRADLYAAGIILYELSTGRPPFRGLGMHELLLAHLQQAPENPTSLNPRIIAAHSSFILRLLAKQRAGRPASALDALQALREANLQADRSGATMTRSLMVEPAALPAPQDLLIAPYIGNSAARQTVLEAGAALLRGEGTALLVGGPQGSGKSRLADEIRAFAAESGITVWAGGGRSEGGVAGQLFQPIFSAAAAEIERKPQNAEGCLGGEGAILAQDFHGLRRLAALHGLKPPALSPEAERSRLLAAAAAFFQRATRRGPLLLLLEDMQWADALSLDLAAHLIANFSEANDEGTAPIFILANHHAELGSPATPFSRWLDRLASPNLRRLNLSPLNEADIGQLLSASLGLPAPPPAAVTRHFHALGGGNPYLTLEALRADIAAGRLQRLGEGGWNFDGWRQSLAAQETPAPLADAAAAAVRRRIAALPEQDLEALRAAALLGRQFPFRWWPAVAGLDEGALVDAADRAIRAGLLEELPGEQLRFTHDLMRAALAADLSGLKRRRLHGKIVETIENEGMVDENLELLAEHAIEARLGDQAAYYGLRTAEKLLGQFMLEAMADLFQRLRLAVPDPGKLPDAVQMQWLALEIHLLQWIGEHGRISALAEPLLRIAAAVDDRERQRIALHALAGFHYSQGNYPLTKQLAQQAYALDCERENPEAARKLQGLLITVAIKTHEFAEAARRLEAERALAANNDNRVVMMTLLHHSGLLCAAQGDEDGLRAYMEESLAISAALPVDQEMGFATSARTKLVEQALKQNDLARAAALLPEAEAGARQLGNRISLIKLNALRGELLIRQGDITQGAGLMQKAAAEAEASGSEALKREIEASCQALVGQSVPVIIGI